MPADANTRALPQTQVHSQPIHQSVTVLYTYDWILLYIRCVRWV